MSDLNTIRTFYEAVVGACHEFYKTAPLNEFWGGLNERTMKAIIYNAKSLEDLVHGAQKTFMFSVNVTDPVKERAVKWLIDEATRSRRLALDGLGLTRIEESVHSYPANNVVVSGQVFTPDSIRCVNIAAEISKHTKVFNGRIVELGGGLGHLARVLRLASISKQHIIVDLPETLAFSAAFLKLNFPDARHQYICGPNQTVLESNDFVFVPVAYAKDVLSGLEVDLFLNTASMGEMRNETIRYWMRFIQQELKPKNLFMLNRFLNTLGPGLEWRVRENECQQHYDRDWVILDWNLEPPYTRCPYVDTLVSRYVQIVATREAMPDSYIKAWTDQIHAEVADEDWWRQRSQGHVMGMRDNPLIIDGGMNGALYKLWELLRLGPTATRVEMMLTYLQRFNRNPRHPFEEVGYYARILPSLRVSRP